MLQVKGCVDWMLAWVGTWEAMAAGVGGRVGRGVVGAEEKRINGLVGGVECGQA